MLGTQTIISLLLNQPRDERVINSLASECLLLVKRYQWRSQLCAAASPKVAGGDFEFESFSCSKSNIILVNSVRDSHLFHCRI